MASDLKKNINEEIGQFINDGRKSSGRPASERLECLKQAERLILESEGESLLDNFLDEMLEFLSDDDEEICSFSLLFIISAVNRDPEIIRKVVDPLYNLLEHNSRYSVNIKKRAIVTCTRIYPQTLLWTNQRRNDREAEKCWKIFEILKVRIMSLIESPNEGLRVMSIKFTETIIVTQSIKSEIEDSKHEEDLVNLSVISRDHRFLSYRKLDNEALQSFNMLLELLSSSTISSQTLLATVYVLCNVARKRPIYMLQVVSALESLHINLPSTLATNQVKSLRKELRFNLLQMLLHPVTFSHHQRFTQFLTDLGCSSVDIQRHMPTPGEVKEALLKRVNIASATTTSSSADRHPLGSGLIPGLSRPADNKEDEPSAKRLRLNEDEYVDEGTAEIFQGANAQDEILDATQRAIDITTEFVYERLSLNVVVKLVTISLFTLPDEMPPAFESSYTDISTAGTDIQKRHLSRILAIQLTKEGEGPGIAHIRANKQKQYLARQNARMEGAAIPPTPSTEEKGSDASVVMPRRDTFVRPREPSKRGRLVKWDLMKQTKELLLPEAQRLCVMSYHRVIQNESRAIQGGASLAQHQLLVRLATRFHSNTSDLYEEQLIEYILADQKNRADLALLWLSELYAQYQGYSLFLTEKGEPDKEVRRIRYEKLLCNLSGLLVSRNDIKETLFHRIFLEVPLITNDALPWLRKACLDPTFGGFAMSTLREMILTRPRQRNELLEMFSTLSYHEPVASKGRSASSTVYDVREQCVAIAKELYNIPYIRDDFYNLIISMSEHLTMLRPPKSLIIHSRRLTEFQASELNEEECSWDETLIRAALHLFMSILPIDHSLLHQLAKITGKATNEVKRLIFRIIEQAIKAIDMNSPQLLEMIDDCPRGAEPLVARIVHLLTERNLPSKELVERVRSLHLQRHTDVRSLLPIMVGLSHDELLRLIPKFVMNATNSKSVPLLYRKLLFGQHIETREYLMDSRELLIQLHKCQPANLCEKSHLLQNIDQLIVDPENQYQLSKERIASAIEDLLREDVLPEIVYHTLQKINDHRPALRSFLSIILPSALQKHPDNEELKELMIRFVDRPQEIPIQQQVMSF